MSFSHNWEIKMTSWPWMKGMGVALADPPMDPVCPEDDRPAVKDLLVEHAEKIRKIKQGIMDHPLFDASKHDDLWVLRFWLSHKKSKAAIAAAKDMLEFRDKYNLDDTDLRDTPPHRVTTGPVHEYLARSVEQDKAAIVYTQPDQARGVVCFVSMGNVDHDALATEVPEEARLPTYIYVTEYSHQLCDYTTRTTGRLTKLVRCFDMRGYRLQHYHRNNMKWDGAAMATMEDCYPQLLATQFFCYPPTFAKVLWELAKLIVPKRVIEKSDMINPATNDNERNRLYHHISEENLPEHFGGSNTVPPHQW